MPSILHEHYDYLSDSVRLEQFTRAIDRLIKPGHVVLDLGCGSGILGLMALRSGARKVYFADEGAVIEVARHTVSGAGFADRAEFLHANSFEMALPERVDVVVCDHVGCFGFDYGILALLADAKKRFLEPDGITVPVELELKLAPVESEESRNEVGQWRNGDVPEDFAWLAPAAANSKYIRSMSARELLAEPARLSTLQLGDEVPQFVSWDAGFTAMRDGELDGIAGWFDCLLFDDVRLTNAPDATRRSHRPQVFLPMEAPVPVKAGDRIQAQVMVRHQDDVIGWVIDLPKTGKRYSHTTFNGLFLDEAMLTRVRKDRVARLNDRGRAAQIVLSYCDGQRTVSEIEALVNKEHPDLFPSEHAVSSFVTQILAWDTSD